ncbi:hypothetical protein NQ176_g9938 [Zarea fungicola]|uniref:Uncharacterized protein n=1 Tax=Zarea fungicola TaxID=93591 RepID=A0ACC1MJA5_9HYPO|nr:hypothetical protein NQ176_g9938 [Lecanicillium fungicola]
MTPGLATVVMQSIQDGNGVPAHYEGIWTDRDDEGLRLVNEVGDAGMNTLLGSKEEMKRVRKARRTRDRLRDKHGQERMTLRMQFLEANDIYAAADGHSS